MVLFWFFFMVVFRVSSFMIGIVNVGIEKNYGFRPLSRKSLSI